jgi:hypothetical protein
MTKVKLVRLVGSGYSGMFDEHVVQVAEVKDQKQLISLIVKSLTSDDQEIAKSYNARITQKNLVENLEGDLSNNICSLALDEETCILILQNASADITEDFEKVFDNFIDELYQLN